MSKSVNIQDISTQAEYLSVEDKHALDLIKLKRALAVAHSEAAELAYNNVVLQLTLKYNLKEQDAITEQGEIVRGKQGV